jgi:hypothetical protein
MRKQKILRKYWSFLFWTILQLLHETVGPTVALIDIGTKLYKYILKYNIWKFKTDENVSVCIHYVWS